MSGMVHSYVVSDNNRFDKRYKRVVDSLVSSVDTRESIIEKFNYMVRGNYGLCEGGYVLDMLNPFKGLCDLVRKIETEENSVDISLLVNDVMGSCEICSVEEEALYGLVVCLACSSGLLIGGLVEGFSTYGDLRYARVGVGVLYCWSCLWGLGAVDYIVDASYVVENLISSRNLLFATDELSRDIVEMGRCIKNSSVIVA